MTANIPYKTESYKNACFGRLVKLLEVRLVMDKSEKILSLKRWV